VRRVSVCEGVCDESLLRDNLRESSVRVPACETLPRESARASLGVCKESDFVRQICEVV
jgi:hypothetical protein